MPDTIVWAHRPLKRLRMKTGLVTCDEVLANELLAEGLVQDPRVGALQLKEITAEKETVAAEGDEEPDVVNRNQTYKTRQLKAQK